MKAYITASGAFLPERIVTNEEIAGRLGLEPEQIYKSSGIRRRRWAKLGTKTSLLAANSLKCALDDAGLTASDIDFLLLGTMTPNRFLPGTAPALQKEMGMGPIPCLDIHAASCNAVYGLELARSMAMSGTAHSIALCFAEIHSAWLEMTPAAGTTSMLFGDGASSMIVSSEPGKHGALEIMDVLLRTDGSYVDDLGIRCPGTEFGNNLNGNWATEQDWYPRMNGHKVLLRAARSMAAACRALLQRNEVKETEIAWVVPHQANVNVMKQVLRALGLSRYPERLISVMEDFANTSSASMGIALDVLRKSRRMRRGDLVLMPAFAAGFTWGAALCRAM